SSLPLNVRQPGIKRFLSIGGVMLGVASMRFAFVSLLLFASLNSWAADTIPSKKGKSLVCLDGRRIHSVEEFHDHLKEAAGFPDSYGRNLDALYDILMEPEFANLRILWLNFDRSLKQLA